MTLQLYPNKIETLKGIFGYKFLLLDYLISPINIGSLIILLFSDEKINFYQNTNNKIAYFPQNEFESKIDFKHYEEKKISFVINKEFSGLYPVNTPATLFYKWEW